MKHVISISLGSSQRDHSVDIELAGKRIRIQRIGVDGRYEKAQSLFRELDGTVDALGLGGAELGVNIARRYYPLQSIQRMVKGVKTPVTDGSGVRAVIEGNCGAWLLENHAEVVNPRRVFFCVASGRFDMVAGFHRAGFEMKFGDAGFILGLPLTTGNFWFAKLIASIWTPFIVRAPFSWLYPIGKQQSERKPKFEAWYQWATVIADDFHYIAKHLPDHIEGKVIITNTTTAEDLEMLRERGAKMLITTTPRFDGRSFGTNVLEAALIAISGKDRVLTPPEIQQLVDELQLVPQVQILDRT